MAPWSGLDHILDTQHQYTWVTTADRSNAYIRLSVPKSLHEKSDRYRGAWLPANRYIFDPVGHPQQRPLAEWKNHRKWAGKNRYTYGIATDLKRRNDPSFAWTVRSGFPHPWSFPNQMAPHPSWVIRADSPDQPLKIARHVSWLNMTAHLHPFFEKDSKNRNISRPADRKTTGIHPGGHNVVVQINPEKRKI